MAKSKKQKRTRSRRDSPQRRRRRVKLLAWCVGIAVCCAAFIVVMRLDAIQIRTVNVEGVETVGAAAVEATARSELAGSYIWLVPRTNAFVYPHDDIKRAISERFSRLAEVAVDREFPDVLTISVTEHEPFALWCRRTKNAETASSTSAFSASDEPCYYLSKDGYVFAQAPGFSGDVYLRYFGGGVTGTSPIGSRVLSRDAFRDLTAFQERAAELGFEPRSVIVAVDGDRYIRTATGAEIRFDTDVPLVSVFNDLKSVMSSRELDLSDPATRTQLEYIDLRFEGKVYYKMRKGSGSSSRRVEG